VTGLRIISLSEVTVPDVERVTSVKALPLFLGHLHGLVGASEIGKSTIAAHAALDVAEAGFNVLVVDGEMSAAAWRRKLTELGASDAAIGRVYYAEMSEAAAGVDQVREATTARMLRLIVWDSALSLISRTCRSENDNAEVGRVFDRLRAIVRDGPAGLVVDHSALAATSPISRGASAKFAALDVSYGVRLTDGSIPGPIDEWSSLISVEKDRHSLLGERRDHEATFVPLGARMLAVDIAEIRGASHRLSPTNPVAELVKQIEQLDPPPKSGNDVAKRLKGHRRSTIQAAYKQWAQGVVPAVPVLDGGTAVPPVPRYPEPVPVGYHPPGGNTNGETA
jgi:hypothetical protein